MSVEEYAAFVSGLDVGGPLASDARLQMLVECLIGEGVGPGDVPVSQITRLIITGNSLASPDLSILI